ncbi:ATP-binding protein [Streptomyces sp. NPDC048442]|uniref:ATP-binding protein n=1 Tax=Streptomyces sp. NPDC048442 TaxID=3154823 RepID=UPI00341BDC60
MSEPETPHRAVEALRRAMEAHGARLVPDPAEPSDIEPGSPVWHRQQRARMALKRWETAAPPRYRKACSTLPDVNDWADRVIADPTTAGSLLLVGPTGTGKTYQAYGALRRIAESGPDRYGVIGTNSADLYGALLPSQNLGQSEQELRRLLTVPLLLVDDFGTAKGSEWKEEITYRLINHRYNHCLPTAFTSNLPVRSDDPSVPDLTGTLGERITSRLAQMAMIVPMIGADRRREAA